MIHSLIIGIDPGEGGAIAFYHSHSVIKLFDMPIMTLPNTKKETCVNGAELTRIIQEQIKENEKYSGSQCNPIAVIEQVHSMPKQGVKSTFNFGVAYGIAQGVISALCIPVEFVTPQKWKKKFGLIGKDKEASRGLAIQKYPHLSESLKRKKDADKAEALLIAISIIEGC